MDAKSAASLPDFQWEVSGREICDDTQIFAMCLALSPAVYRWGDCSNSTTACLATAFLQEKGQARINDRWKSENPIYLTKSLPLNELRTVRFYIDCAT